MSIEELMSKHVSVRCRNDGNYVEHTNLSIEFAISMLEELKAIALNRGFNDVAYDNLFYLKIQELKQQLNK